MANHRELEIVIRPDGTVEITTRGIKGPDCKPVLDKFAKGIGEITHEERTSEWYEVSSTESKHIHIDGSVK